MRDLGDGACHAIQEPGQCAAFGFCINDSVELAFEKQRMFDGIEFRLKAAYGHALPYTKLHLRLRLDHPSTRRELPVDQRPGPILRVECGFVHRTTLRRVEPGGKGSAVNDSSA